MASIISLTPNQLRRAADIQEKIEELRDEFFDIMGKEAGTPRVELSGAKRRLGARGLNKSRAGAKRRSTKARKVQNLAKPTVKSVSRSSAWRTAISAAAKARWAKAKAAGRNRL